MYTSFHLHTSELDETFLKTLKKMFKNKRISISVEEEMDETDYLLASESNRKHLTESLASKEQVSFSINELKQHSLILKKHKTKAS